MSYSKSVLVPVVLAMLIAAAVDVKPASAAAQQSTSLAPTIGPPKHSTTLLSGQSADLTLPTSTTEFAATKSASTTTQAVSSGTYP